MRGRPDKIADAIDRAEKRLGFDWRTSWSSISVDAGGLLRVSVSRGEVREAVMSDIAVEEGIEVGLAGGTAETQLWAVSSVVDVRREPEHSSELLTQAIMGETMTLLDSRGDWFLVMLDDGYHGWVRSWYVSETKRDEIASYAGRAGAVVGAGVAYVLSEPHTGSLPVSDITAGSIIVAGGAQDDFTAVELPGGREGFIATAVLEPIPSGRSGRSRITGRAGRFLGIPYIWGGTSAKGFDCSGLVKRVFRMEGIDTARDADQQSTGGAAVEVAGPDGIPEADLLFFGEGGRITHVAISLGGGRFIHSYGNVRINSLIENDEIYDAKLAGIFLFARDLLGVSAR
jgi:hypothetical protein